MLATTRRRPRPSATSWPTCRVVKTGPATVLAGQRVDVDDHGAQRRSVGRRRTSSSPTRCRPASPTSRSIPPGGRRLHDDADDHLHARRPAGRHGDRRGPVSALVPSGSALATLANSVQVDVDDPRPGRGNNTDCGHHDDRATGAAADQQGRRPVAVRARARRRLHGRHRQRRAVGRRGHPGRRHARPDPDAERPALPSQGTCTYTVGGAQLRARCRAAGGSVTVRIPVRVDPGDHGHTLTNTATRVDRHAGAAGAPPATATVISGRPARRSDARPRPAPAEVIAGTPIAWNLGVSNAGPSVAGDVVVTDTLPPDLGDDDDRASQGACTAVGRHDHMPARQPRAGRGRARSRSPAPCRPTRPRRRWSTRPSSPRRPPSPAPDPTTGARRRPPTAVVTRADMPSPSAPTATPPCPAQPVQWTMTVGNAGPSVARDVARHRRAAGRADRRRVRRPGRRDLRRRAATCDIATLAVGSAPGDRRSTSRPICLPTRRRRP